MVRNMVILSAIKKMEREDWSQEGWRKAWSETGGDLKVAKGWNFQGRENE